MKEIFFDTAYPVILSKAEIAMYENEIIEYTPGRCYKQHRDDCQVIVQENHFWNLMCVNNVSMAAIAQYQLLIIL